MKWALRSGQASAEKNATSHAVEVGVGDEVITAQGHDIEVGRSAGDPIAVVVEDVVGAEEGRRPDRHEDVQLAGRDARDGHEDEEQQQLLHGPDPSQWCDGDGGTQDGPAEVDGNRTRRTGIARPNRFEGGGAHQVPGHLPARGERRRSTRWSVEVSTR